MLEINARDSTAGDLKKAFRRASVKYHPDKNPNKDTTDLFIEVKNANDIIGDERMRYAYDVFAQTNWQQEENILKGLRYSKLAPEEQEKLFWHIINNKRMFQSGLEIVPFYASWVMAVILLVNRSYGRTCLALTVAAVGAFEFFSKLYYGDARFDPLITTALNLFPSTYTLCEALKVLRYGMPLILQALLLMLDNSFDIPSEKPDDPTELLHKICSKQKLLIEECKQILKECEKVD